MRYLLSIGSNAPGCRQFMQKAMQWLAENFTDIESSGIYSSPALNGVTADYLNLVALGNSELSPTDLTAATKAFERRLGRTPESKMRGEIEIDIDIIAAGQTILRPAEYTRSYFLRGLSLLSELHK
ncbi:MAG: 2-amino-4-hydroxy-6-hydroxymethyldihydropteridine diphosphokinase [Muribaculaceae bacterium]|nr:2-amino-4-hydroxy-6-hydroxymethyldihydropteridine diphosphokinase [Muribaculaceae bacterium]